MAKVEAVFTLTDRVSKRLESMAAKAGAAERALGSLDRKIDRINRKLEVLSLRLHGLPNRITITIDLDDRATPRLIAMKALTSFGGVSSSRGRTPGISSAGGAATAVGQRSAAQVAMAARVAANRRMAGAMFGGNPYVRTPEQIAAQRRMNEGMIRRPMRMLDRVLGAEDAGGVYDDSPNAAGGGRGGRRRNWRLHMPGGEGFINNRGGVFGRMMRSARDSEGFSKRIDRLLSGGRGGWMRGGSLGVFLALSGALSGGTGLAGALGAGAMGLGAGALAGLGLGGVLAAGAIPLATSTVKANKRIQDAQQDVRNAKTQEELATATKELQKAQAALTPVQKQLIADASTLKDLYKDMFKPVQQNIANILSSVTRASTKLAPMIGPHVAAFGQAGENIARRAENFISDPREIAMLNRMLAPLPGLSEKVARVLGYVLVIVERLVIAATPLATWMFDAMGDKLQKIADITKGGDLDGWIRGFDRFRPILTELGGLIGDMLSSLNRMFDDVLPFATNLVKVIRSAFLPALEEVIRVGAQVTGPAVLGLLNELLIFIKDNAAPVGYLLKVIADVLTLIMKAINGLQNLPGGSIVTGGLFLGIISLVLGFKVLRMLQGIAKVLGFELAPGLGGIKQIGRGVFSPLISGAKSAMGILKRLIARLFGVRDAEIAASTAGSGGGVAGGGGVGNAAKKAGKRGIPGWLAWGSKGLLRGAGAVGLGLLVEDTVTGIAPGAMEGGNHWWNTKHPIQDYFNPGKWGGIFGGGGSPAKNAGSYYMGRNRPMAPMAKNAGGGSTAVIFNGPVNINNGQDENEFIAKLQAAVGKASTNMPHIGWSGSGGNP